MADQHERAFQKQEPIFIGDKRLLGKKATLKRYFKNPGLSFQVPKEAKEGKYIDKKCPFTGSAVSIRGNVLKGMCISAQKMKNTVVLRRCYLHYIRKYKRFEKRLKPFRLNPLARSSSVSGVTLGTNAMVHSQHRHSHHKADDDDSPPRLHERLSLDSIMTKNFDNTVEIEQQIEEVVIEKQTGGKQRDSAYDLQIQELDGGIKAAEHHDKVVNQEEAEMERLLQEKARREEMRKKKKESAKKLEQEKKEGEVTVEEAPTKTYAGSGKNCKIDDLFCCLDRNDDYQKCPNKRPPK